MEKITLQNMEQIAREKTGNCPDCGSNELTIGINGTKGTGIYQNTIFMGMNASQQFSGLKMIICTNCGLIIKQFASTPEKLLKL